MRTQTSEIGPHAADNHSVSAASLVQKAWDHSDGTMPDAADILFTYASKDQDFLNQHLEAILRSWCRDEVSKHVGAVRLSAWMPENHSETGNGKRLRTAFSNGLMDFPLPGGKRLGDATAGEVLQGSQFYLQSAADLAHKGRWLNAVATYLKGSKTVSQSLNERKLRELQEKTNAS